ncbi:MAG TPA: sortase, partial [Anaerolineales bacterium]
SLSASAPDVTIVEPDMSMAKSASPTTARAGQPISFTLLISHTTQSSADAHDVLVTDALPVGLSYVACSLSYSGLTPDSNKRPADPCNLGSTTLSFGWDSFPHGQTSTITFQATFTGAQQNVINTATAAWTSLPLDPAGGMPVQLSTYNTQSTEREYDPGDPVNAYLISDSVTIGFGNALPDTGFAPNKTTAISIQPLEKQYTATDVWLEIASLGVKADIVGVPYVDGKWDVSWLWNQAGWLNGTAFPSWQGNSVISGHTYLSNGKAGIFANLSKLKWNDKIIIHLHGNKYIYTVQENKVVTPSDTSVLKHEENSWLTLLTCKTFNEKTNSYENRVAVRAILVSIEAHK